MLVTHHSHTALVSTGRAHARICLLVLVFALVPVCVPAPAAPPRGGESHTLVLWVWSVLGCTISGTCLQRALLGVALQCTFRALHASRWFNQRGHAVERHLAVCPTRTTTACSTYLSGTRGIRVSAGVGCAHISTTLSRESTQPGHRCARARALSRPSPPSSVAIRRLGCVAREAVQCSVRACVVLPASSRDNAEPNFEAR